MAKPRNPAKCHNMATARVNDFTKAELRELSERTGLSLSEVTRAAILAGLPKIKKELKPSQ